jgi:hypothetical protein
MGVLAVTAPYVLRGESLSARPIIGAGEYRYECIHDGRDLPPSINYGAKLPDSGPAHLVPDWKLISSGVAVIVRR